MQSVITSAFEKLKAQEAAGGNRIIIDQFVFAYIPSMTTTSTPSPDEAMPPAARIVHRQNTDKNGMVNENTVAYSVLLPEFLGNFTFNWLGLVSSATDTLCQVIYLDPQEKLKTTNGKQGNTLIYSPTMEYTGASAATGITTPVSTWQIDFTARLHGMDEATRKAALDIYGPGLFFDDAFKLTAAGTGQATFAPGIAYLRGLRVELDAQGTLTFVTGKAQTVYIDAALTGTLTGENKATFSLTSQKTADYTDSLNQAHYVEPVATISAGGVITDIRRTRKRISDHLDSLGNDFLSRKKNLSDIEDVTKALTSLTLDGVKKAVEETHLGLSKLPWFLPATEDDLTSLPAGYMAISKNATPGGPLPGENWYYLRVMGSLDNNNDNPKRKGAVIELVQVGYPKEIWKGVKFDDGSTTTAIFAWSRDFNSLNKPTPEDVGLAVTKKAVDDTQLGLIKQPAMTVNSPDDLSNLPAGAHRFAINAPGKTVLPSEYSYHVAVLGKSGANGGICILAIEYGNAGDYWIGRRTNPSVDADFKWTPLVQTIKNLSLTDTVNLAAGAMQKNQNGADIPNKPLFVKTLGIVDAYPIGCPIPYPGPTAPNGYLLMDGRAFSQPLYPQLARLYPNGILPDLRGMHIRGWDNGRGLDNYEYVQHGNTDASSLSVSQIASGAYDIFGLETSPTRSRGLLKPQYLTAVLTDRDVRNDAIVRGEITDISTGGFIHYEGLRFEETPAGLRIIRNGVNASSPSYQISYTRDRTIRVGAPNIAFNYITKAT